MSEQVPTGLLEVGRFGKPHGVRGQISVRLSTDRTERLDPGARVWSGSWRTVLASAAVPGSDRWIVTLDGLEDRTSAEKLVNRTIWAEPIEDDDAVWVHQIIGAKMRDTEGRDRGTCLSVIANPAHDLIELDSGALVPVIFVTSVTGDDSGTFTVIVDPPAGLFELFDDSQPEAGEGSGVEFMR